MAGFKRGFEALQQFGAFQHRHAVLLGQRSGGVLEPEHPKLLGRRPDEGDTGRLASLGKGGILGKKTVAGMNRRRTGGLRDIEDLVDHQIGVRCSAFTEAMGFISLLDVQAGGIRF